MTKLDRVLELLERYDSLAGNLLTSYHNGKYGWVILGDLRKEKEALTQELIEHGCGRKN